MTQEEIDREIEVIDREIEEVKAEIEYERESHREAINRSEWFEQDHAETMRDLEGKLFLLRKSRDELEMAIPHVDVEPPPNKIALFVVGRR